MYEFQYTVVNSGAGLVLYLWFVLALVFNSENKQFIIVSLMLWVYVAIIIDNIWYNEPMNFLRLSSAC